LASHSIISACDSHLWMTCCRNSGTKFARSRCCGVVALFSLCGERKWKLHWRQKRSKIMDMWVCTEIWLRSVGEEECGVFPAGKCSDIRNLIWLNARCKRKKRRHGNIEIPQSNDESRAWCYNSFVDRVVQKRGRKVLFWKKCRACPAATAKWALCWQGMPITPFVIKRQLPPVAQVTSPLA